MSVARRARRRAARRRRARSRASCSTARSPSRVGRALPVRHARRQPQRRVRCSACCAGAGVGGDAFRLAGTGPARRLHDVQHLGAREPPPRRGRAAARSGAPTSPSASRSASALRVARRPARRRAVSEDGLKLTTYFGERDRADGAFLADALTDALRAPRAAREPAAARRRGLRRQAPPAHRPAADALGGPAARLGRRRRRARGSRRALDEVEALRGDGLVTLERARLLAGATPDAVDAAATTKLTVYVGRQRARRRPAGARGRRRRSCTATASPGRPCCSASTAPRTAMRQRARFFAAQRRGAADGRRGRRRRAHRRRAARAARAAARAAAHARARPRVQARRRAARRARAGRRAPTRPGWPSGRS